MEKNILGVQTHLSVDCETVTVGWTQYKYNDSELLKTGVHGNKNCTEKHSMMTYECLLSNSQD